MRSITDIEHDVEHDIEHDADHDAEHDISSGMKLTIAHSFLSILGIGRCPLLNHYDELLFPVHLHRSEREHPLKSSLAAFPIYGVMSYIFSMILGFFLTGRLAGIIGKLMPTCETYIRQESSLVGRLGKSVYNFTENRGYVQVYDNTKTLKEISAENMEPDQPIAREMMCLSLIMIRKKGYSKLHWLRMN
ncbi:MAG: YqiJ family protein [Desulfobacteraceae bacterium]|nr:YqiJ family protein [Desulfobacteraceae bacterium]